MARLRREHLHFGRCPLSFGLEVQIMGNLMASKWPPFKAQYMYLFCIVIANEWVIFERNFAKWRESLSKNDREHR